MTQRVYVAPVLYPSGLKSLKQKRISEETLFAKSGVLRNYRTILVTLKKSL